MNTVFTGKSLPDGDKKVKNEEARMTKEAFLCPLIHTSQKYGVNPQTQNRG
jgi:hypothetical protein